MAEAEEVAMKRVVTLIIQEGSAQEEEEAEV